LSCSTIFASEKHALIIALSEYNQGTSWHSLNSFRDVPLISEALKRHGFDHANIRIITDKTSGTKRGIIDAFEKLISEVNKGDIVVFHFSGHGQPVMDRNGDELDGFDESIVPIDANRLFIPGVYEGQKHITDDELGKLLTKLREKLGIGGDLMVTIDACQSGTATRGRASYRGTAKPMAPKDYRPDPNEIADSAFGLYDTDSKLSTMVVISATAPNQNNWEATDKNGNKVGALSLALSKALISSDENTTYRGLFEKIRRIVALNMFPQTPQIEGNIDKQVLGGELLAKPSYFGVIKHLGEKKIQIDAGELHGIFEGSEVSLYPPETRNLERPEIVKGIVEQSDMVKAVVALDEVVSKKDLVSSWGYVSNRNFGKMNISIQLESKSEEFKSRFKNIIQDYPFIKLVDSEADLFIEQYENSNDLVLLDGKGALLYQDSVIGSTELSTQNILKRVIKYAQVNFLRELENYDQNLKVKLDIIPVSTRKIGRRIITKEKLPLQHKVGPDGILTFQKGDHFICHIINLGNKSVYVSLLDIQPNNEISVLLPQKRKPARDYFISPGDTLKLDQLPWEVNEPYGIDILKLVATETELNLRSVLDSQGTIPQTRGKSVNPFEELFANTFKQQNRGKNSPSIPPSTTHISNQIIRIIPRRNN